MASNDDSADAADATAENPATPKDDGASDDATEISRHIVRLPRFIASSSIGLGDVVKRTTSTVGVKPCGGCQDRAARLNRWLQFSPRN